MLKTRTKAMWVLVAAAKTQFQNGVKFHSQAKPGDKFLVVAPLIGCTYG